MNVKELNRNQLEELKQRYYTEKNGNASYGELANINELVTDEEVMKEYDNVDFVEDDFFSSQEEKKIMNFEQALEVVRTLSKSQGFYCRVLQDMEQFSEEQKEAFEIALKENCIKEPVDLVLLFET